MAVKFAADKWEDGWMMMKKNLTVMDDSVALACIALSARHRVLAIPHPQYPPRGRAQELASMAVEG
jgi:hypothetical protein